MSPRTRRLLYRVLVADLALIWVGLAYVILATAFHWPGGGHV